MATKFLVGQLMGHPAPPEEDPDPRFVLSRCRIGMEFEFENPQAVQVPRQGDGHPVYEYYNKVSDGSLRDNGIEFIFSTPLMGKQLTNALIRMQEFIDEVPLRGTYRTSTHVHLDLRNLDFDELKTFAFLYALTEKYFYAFANQFVVDGKPKEDSNYCVPWSSSDGYAFAVGESIFSSTPRNAPGKINKMQRYAGLNLNAVAKYGSGEFRHLPTITQVASLVNFINMTMSLKKAAKAQPLEDWQGLAWLGKDAVRNAVFGDVPVVDITDDEFGLCHETATLIQSVVDVSRFQWQHDSEVKGPNPFYPKEGAK